jgi:hypothetical protein
LHGQSQFFTLRRVARTGYDFFRLWLKLVIFSTQRRTEEAYEKRREWPSEESPARFPLRLRIRKCESGAGDRIPDYSSDKQPS